jgi:hypothetical protein
LRKTAIAQFRLVAGHDVLQSHLYRCKIIKDPPNCDSSEAQDRTHLFRCAALISEVESLPDNLSRQEKEAIIYWIAKKKLIPDQRKSCPELGCWRGGGRDAKKSKKKKIHRKLARNGNNQMCLTKLKNKNKYLVIIKIGIIASPKLTYFPFRFGGQNKCMVFCRN